ncbi:MAG: hypothetical protein OT477_14735 [Chloroflexi bacterium]|nr:hypothetical protein [Chloroflexota bacterium]
MTIRTYPNLTAARADLRAAVLILPFANWSGQRADKKWWAAEKNGELLDYDTPQALAKDYLLKGEEVYKLTVRRDGGITASPIGITSAMQAILDNPHAETSNNRLAQQMHDDGLITITDRWVTRKGSPGAAMQGIKNGRWVVCYTVNHDHPLVKAQAAKAAKEEPAP